MQSKEDIAFEEKEYPKTKFVDDLGGYMHITLNNKWNLVAQLLGLACEEQEAVKECYKEYIGIVKIYYEDALRAKQGKADVEGYGRGTADIDPQPDADLEDADLEDESPRKRQLNMKERTSNKAIKLQKMQRRNETANQRWTRTE